MGKFLHRLALIRRSRALPPTLPQQFATVTCCIVKFVVQRRQLAEDIKYKPRKGYFSFRVLLKNLYPVCDCSVGTILQQQGMFIVVDSRRGAHDPGPDDTSAL